MIVLFIVLYKFGEALARTMSRSAVRLARLHQARVANIGRSTALPRRSPALPWAAWSSTGSACFGRCCLRDPAGILELMYAVRVWAGHDVVFLALTIGWRRPTAWDRPRSSHLSGLCNVSHRDAICALVLAGRRRAHGPVGLGRKDGVCWMDAVLPGQPVLCIPGLLLLLWVMRSPPWRPQLSRKPTAGAVAVEPGAWRHAIRGQALHQAPEARSWFISARCATSCATT